MRLHMQNKSSAWLWLRIFFFSEKPSIATRAHDKPVFSRLPLRTSPHKKNASCDYRLPPPSSTVIQQYSIDIIVPTCNWRAACPTAFVCPPSVAGPRCAAVAVTKLFSAPFPTVARFGTRTTYLLLWNHQQRTPSPDCLKLACCFRAK